MTPRSRTKISIEIPESQFASVTSLILKGIFQHLPFVTLAQPELILFLTSNDSLHVARSEKTFLDASPILLGQGKYLTKGTGDIDLRRTVDED